MVRNHRRKLDAKLRQARTGESYQAAVHAVRERPTFTTDALAARRAVKAGDTKAVDAFSRKRLGLQNPHRWRLRVEIALLSDWDATASDQSRRDRLKYRVFTEIRKWMPRRQLEQLDRMGAELERRLWETLFGGRTNAAPALTLRVDPVLFAMHSAFVRSGQRRPLATRGGIA